MNRNHGLQRWFIRLIGWLKPVLVGMLILIGMGGIAAVMTDHWLMPLPEDLLHRPSATFVYSREGRLLSAFTSSDQFWRKPVGIDQISPKLIASVLTIEDRYFYQHPGVNVVSLIKAGVANLRAGRTVRGGSTLTMQIARMIEPKERTIRNKLLEIFRAFQLEARYSKVELLEFYFNLAPYGGNLEGIGAAAHFYFDKAVSDLAWSEAALLTAIPGSPERYRPDRYLARGRQRSNVILERLRTASVVTMHEYEAAISEEIPSQRLSVPHLAPHLSVSLRARFPDSSQLHTTLKYETQLACERLARAYHQKNVARDIHNLAIVVIDNRKAEIIASVGSPDFADASHSGQVDASVAARSLGSALKPFVYGLAFDLGLLSPELRVADIPVNYSGYRPVNYDETYRGVISVREALVRSLNIPAVNAASVVGLKKLHDLLRRGGLTTVERPHYEYGLPLVLGACGVRLDELTNLYAALAREGVYRPLKMLAGSIDDHEVRLFSPETSYLLADILVELERPDLPDSWRASSSKFPVAWKTGTSYGRRDAWTIGYRPDYTVGVWAGNCSGEGSVDLVGAKVAAPLMFDVFAEIVVGTGRPWYQAPAGIGERQVCGVSGRPVGRHCQESTGEIFVIGTSPAATCSVHRPIFVSRKTGLRLTARCIRTVQHDRRVIETWPPKIASWLVSNRLGQATPAYDPDCISVAVGSKPSILSPEPGAVFELVDDLAARYQKIRLQASVAAGDGMIDWFLDGEHLAAVSAGEAMFYLPTRGRHTLLCVDDAGRSTSSTFIVN